MLTLRMSFTQGGNHFISRNTIFDSGKGTYPGISDSPTVDDEGCESVEREENTYIHTQACTCIHALTTVHVSA